MTSNGRVFARLAPVLIAATVGSPLIPNGASAQLLTRPPYQTPQPGANPTANVVLDAMMAVARAAATNPQAAAAASLSYQQAVQSYNLGDFSRARTEAISALIAANRPSMAPIPVLGSTVGQSRVGPIGAVQTNAFPLSGATIAQTDADFFVAQARGAVASCRSASSPQTTAAAASLTAAERDDRAGRYTDAKREARDAVERCAVTSATP
jgi:hypothetical protein